MFHRDYTLLHPSALDIDLAYRYLHPFWTTPSPHWLAVLHLDGPGGGLTRLGRRFMPPKNKSKNAPNQHDKRHESGLAPPGKRVIKKPSNGQLNGSPNGKPVPAPTLPSTGLNSGFKFPRPADHAEPASPPATRDYAVPLEGTERDRVCSDAELEEGGQCDDMGDASVEPATSAAPSIDVQPPLHKAATSKHGTGRLAAISTILSYYPLRDAISILILLLSLPPTLVLVIQTLFASLTFVPPTASISLSTLPNFKEMFNSPNFGYPALATILFVDLMFWFVWALVWKPMQNIFLDLSQAVIAVSLSGAAASTGGPTYSIATTTIIVCVVHVLRYRAIHLTALDYLRSVIHKMDIGIQFDAPSFATTLVSSPSLERSSFQTTCRIILGIHIVSQGVTTCIRRSLVKANEQSANTPAVAKTDTEATAGCEPNIRPGTGLAEASQHGASTISSDGRPPGPSPSFSESKLRETSGKRKRKQANQVRSQQPLWAAIASTKVTFVKEMEQRESADDARESAKMDTTATNNNVHNIYRTTDRVWVCEVRDTEILFSVELSSLSWSETAETADDGKSLSAGIDKSKPFFIRINGAAWSSTRIMPSSATDDSGVKKGEQYDGEIFGLAPLSSYHCEVVSMDSQQVLCSASIITQPAPTAEQTASSSQPQHQALRPASPITTLKQSIVSAEAKLKDTQNRCRKTKKDQRTTLSEIRKEVNMYKGKVDSAGADDKLERRIAQITQHKNQAEEAAADLKNEMDALGDLPANDVAQSEAAKRRWQSATNTKSGANRELESAKNEGDRETNALRAEHTQTKTRREKAATRLQQRSDELEKLKVKQHAEMSAKQKREYELAQRHQQRENEEKAYQFQISSMEADIQTLQQKAHDSYAEIAALQSWPGQPPPYPGYSQPPTPENAQSGANGVLPNPQNAAFTPFGPVQFNAAFHSPQSSMAQHQSAPQTRGRSSSMLSAYSGFTDGADDNLLPPEHRPQPYNWNLQPSAGTGAPQVLDDRKESEGSGNSGSLNGGSTGSNSPRPDAKVFVPGSKVTPLSPIGPPGGSKGKEKAPQSPLQNHASADCR